MGDGNVEGVSPNMYKSKGQNKFAFSQIIFIQLQKCLEYGTVASTNKDGLRRFERAVKMLEAFLINFMTEKHKILVKETINKSYMALKNNDMNEYYECIRLRFIYLMQILNKVQDLIPEEKAMELIGEERDVIDKVINDDDED